jgi:hypothetical protein
LDVPDAAGLMPGGFARVVVPAGASETIEVSASALVQRGQLEMLFVITNQQAHLHLVKTGHRAKNVIEILSGIGPGDMVATEGAMGLMDGQRVEVK